MRQLGTIIPGFPIPIYLAKTMRINHFLMCFSVLIVLSCFPYGLSAKEAPGNVADKVKELTDLKPPAETPSGTQPAEPANPGQNPAKPRQASPGKPEIPSKPETPTEPSNPADPVKTGNPPEQTPSGTQPAEPANPGENPAKPADPAKPGENPAKPADPANPGDNPAKPAEPGDKGQPEEADKGRKDKDNKDAKDKKDKTDKDSKNKKHKHGEGGKSGGGPSAPSLPSGVPTPPNAGASLLPAAGAAGSGIAGGIIGGIFSGGKKKAEKEEKKEVPPPALKKAAKEAAVSSETVKAATPVQTSTETAKAAMPVQAVSIASGTVQASTRAVVVEPLYSAGKGPKISVMDFEGEMGPEFAALLSAALSADLKVYSPKALAAKEYDPAAITRVSAKKIAAEIAVEYIVTGKVSKKSETLSIISVFLRDGKTGDIKMMASQNLRGADKPEALAALVAHKIKVKIAELD